MCQHHARRRVIVEKSFGPHGHRHDVLLYINGLRGIFAAIGELCVGRLRTTADDRGLSGVLHKCLKSKRFGRCGQCGRPFPLIILKGINRERVRTRRNGGEQRPSWRLAIAMPLLGRCAPRQNIEIQEVICFGVEFLNLGVGGSSPSGRATLPKRPCPAGPPPRPQNVNECKPQPGHWIYSNALANRLFGFEDFGSGGGTRTPDPRIMIPLL